MRRLIALLVLAGCGAPAVTSTPLTPTGEARWASLDFARRHEIMTFTVLPVLARRFQQYYGTADADLACISCHGRDAEAVDYAMPNGLAPLRPDALPRTEEARFMADVVTPTFDRLIGGGGRTGCFTCHEVAR